MHGTVGKFDSTKSAVFASRGKLLLSKHDTMVSQVSQNVSCGLASCLSMSTLRLCHVGLRMRRHNDGQRGRPQGSERDELLEANGSDCQEWRAVRF